MDAWDVVGWIGLALFFSRFFVQWLASERAGRSVAPRIFWWLSLGAAALFTAFSYGKGEPMLMGAFAVNSAIYVRNLLLVRARAFSPPVLAFGVALALAVLWYCGEIVPEKYELDDKSGVWFWVGTVGSIAWSLRFILQWWHSERLGRSNFPVSFWYVSLFGNALLLAYALHLGDTILIAGFSTGPLVQIRNLMLESRRSAEPQVSSA